MAAVGAKRSLCASRLPLPVSLRLGKGVCGSKALTPGGEAAWARDSATRFICPFVGGNKGSSPAPEPSDHPPPHPTVTGRTDQPLLQMVPLCAGD